MPFTNLDKALCDRLARRLRTQANMLLTIYGSNWQASKDSREAKLEFDRLERDARDAGLLAKRMVGEEKQRRLAAAAKVDQSTEKITPEEAAASSHVILSALGGSVGEHMALAELNSSSPIGGDGGGGAGIPGGVAHG